MATKPTFSQEMKHLLYATKGNPVQMCMQCATCSSTCPAALFMDHSPREIIAMIAADLKNDVLASNSYWYCASCYECSVRCPRGINVAEMMYGLKRYSMWKHRYQTGLIGPAFSRQFVKIILRTGKSYEPGLAPVFLFKYGWRSFLYDTRMALRLLLKGRIPLFPSRIKRIKPFRQMLGRIIPLGGLA